MAFSALSTTASTTPLGGILLIAYAFAYSVGLFENIVEQVTHVVGDAVDDGKDLLQDISNQVGGGYTKVFGEFSNVVGELLRDPRMEDSLFAASVSVSSVAPGLAPMAVI